jgi:hypothetical protein
MSKANEQEVARMVTRWQRLAEDVIKEQNREGCRVVHTDYTPVSEIIDGEAIAFNEWHIRVRCDDGSIKNIRQQPTTTIHIEARPEKNEESVRVEIARKFQEAEWTTGEDI